MKAGIDYPGISVAMFCHDGNGNFVFHKRSNQTRDHWGTWDCGGGGIEFGETLEAACLRELKEEYGCDGSIEETLPPNTFLSSDQGKNHHWIIHPFVIRVKKEDVIIGEPDKMEEIGWFTLNNLPTTLHPGVADDLKTYQEQLLKYSL